MEADDGDYFLISDTIATIAKVKSSSELAAVFEVVDKINHKNEFVSSVSHDDMHECKFHGKVLWFEELLNGYLVWSGKYGASMICDGIQSIIMTSKQQNLDD